MMRRDAVPSFDAADVRGQLNDMSRQPFRDVLTTLIGAKPVAESVAEFARKHPDRWAQACAIFGRRAGYSDKVKIDASVTARRQRSHVRVVSGAPGAFGRGPG